MAILIVSLGNCFPEIILAIYFGQERRKVDGVGRHDGCWIVCATLVLGIVALVAPFTNNRFSAFIVARVFTIIACIFYFNVLSSRKKLTKKEGLFCFLYI